MKEESTLESAIREAMNRAHHEDGQLKGYGLLVLRDKKSGAIAISESYYHESVSLPMESPNEIMYFAEVWQMEGCRDSKGYAVWDDGEPATEADFLSWVDTIAAEEASSYVEWLANEELVNQN